MVAANRCLGHPVLYRRTWRGLWIARKSLSSPTVMADVKKGERCRVSVLPNSMVQMILIWIALLALL